LATESRLPAPALLIVGRVTRLVPAIASQIAGFRSSNFRNHNDDSKPKYSKY
jgi:hypothetical protein